jgi:hypothetical protein
MSSVFPWGTLTKVHCIPGLPPIREYTVGAAFDERGKTNFQIEDSEYGTISYDTFDQALVRLLADKYGAPAMDSIFWKLMEKKPS